MDERQQVASLPADVRREYLMERRYHGVDHDEALRRAFSSPWISKKKEVK